MSNLYAQIDKQIEELSSIKQQILNYQREQNQKIYDGKISDIAKFGERLNAKRKQLNIDLVTLELQTGVSISTLKRVFKDPSQVKFSTVLIVADSLGVAICEA